jgi:hypothetical protein
MDSGQYGAGLESKGKTMCAVFKVVRKAGGRLQEVFVGMTQDASGSVPRRSSIRGHAHSDALHDPVRLSGNAPRQSCKGNRRPKYGMVFDGKRVK